MKLFTSWIYSNILFWLNYHWSYLYFSCPGYNL